VPEVGRAGTVHVGGTRAEMARATPFSARGEHADLPMTLVSDPTVVDDTRLVHGRRPLWTYAHVPAGSDVDVTEAVTRHIERYAPGFRDVVVTSRCVPAAHLSDHNENYVDGDISAGRASIGQLFARPTRRFSGFRSDPSSIRLVNRAVPRVASTRDIATRAPVIAAAATISARPALPWSSASGGLCPVFAFHACASSFWTTRAARKATPAPTIFAMMDCLCLSVTRPSGV